MYHVYTQTGFERLPDDVPPPEASLWRYLDLTKLIDLLSTQTLYFPASDLLGDPFEGSMPRLDHQRITRMYEDDPRFLPDRKLYFEALVKGTYVSCWHVNEGESAAMWGLYLKSDEGVAIKTKYNRLERCLTEANYHVLGGNVKYIDYEKEVIGPSGILGQFFRKRLSFSHEQEFRAVISPYIQMGEGPDLPWPLGLRIPINCQDVIEDVYVAPDTDDWVKDVVHSVLTKFNLDRVVQRSALSGSPLFY